jgi:hypothetical protein
VSIGDSRGEFLALMGPSGSGKTTLLNLMGGLDSPTSGAVEVGGERISALSGGQLSRWRSQHIGFVFQLYNLLAVLTAERNVELPLLLTKLSKAERRKRVAIALRVVGLADRAKHFPRQLSGGRNVGIARPCHRPDAASVRRTDRRSRPEGRRRDPRVAAGAQSRPRKDNCDGDARSACGRAREADGPSRQGRVDGGSRMKFLPLVWRNLLRRKVRTTFTLLSIFVAFVLTELVPSNAVATNLGEQAAGDRLMMMHKVSLIQLLPISYGTSSRRLA